MTDLAHSMQMEVTYSDNLNAPRLKVDGRELAGELRAKEVDGWVSLVSSYSGVRRALVARQRALAEEGGIIMVGRDIGTVVLPDADLKVFLTASREERAQRRYREMEEKGQSASLEQVMENLLARDEMDSGPGRLAAASGRGSVYAQHKRDGPR